MKQRKKVKWSRLDNASKIFPATCSQKDTRVFRFACELYEKVEPETLQRSLDITIEDFPLYRSVLRRGLFWYYFENSDIQPVVEVESKPVCAPLYIKDSRNLLFRVSYYNNRINIEIFHSLSDGTGALWFMQTLVYNYLNLKYNGTYGAEKPKLNYGASESEKMDDSFRRYFPGDHIFNLRKEERKNRNVKGIYHIKGKRSDENRVNLIEGAMSTKAVLALAHRYNVTLTVYIASVLIYSIHKQMRPWEKNRSVVLLVPINLRRFYESETSRNFFSTMDIGYRFDKKDAGFDEIVASVSESFNRELSERRFSTQQNIYMSLEKLPALRIVPLPLKNYSLRLANRIDDRKITAALSNIGRISMPSQFEPYIKQFSVCSSARRPMMAVCSYMDRLVIGFTSPYIETDTQRTFFKFLSNLGIDIEISSNL